MSYSHEAKRAIAIAQHLAKEYGNGTFGPPHLLQAVLHNEVGLASWLATLPKDIHFMREWAEIRMEDYPKAGKPPANPAADSQAAAVLELAGLVSLQLNHDQTDPVSILAGLLKPGVAFSRDQLKTFPLNQKEAMDADVADQELRQAIGGLNGGNTGVSNRLAEGDGGADDKGPAALYKYCKDKTALAADKKLDPIIGRDRELRMVLEVLGRRTKPNVIIVGEPGVGKTALVDGFAHTIVAGKVPEALRNARLFELDTGALVAGAAYKGEVEDRFRHILRELQQYERAILFIDEIHVLLDSHGSIGTGVVNLLKPELARGQLTLIGATTSEEYRKYIESDEAFSRRFELVQVEEPDIATAVAMLRFITPLYEDHHGLKVEDEALAEAVSLAKRYSKDRRLPDSAVDLLDRTMAAIKMMTETSAKELTGMLERLDADAAGRDITWMYKALKDKISPILLTRLGQQTTNVDDLDLPGTEVSKLRQALVQLIGLAGEKKATVNKSDIAAIISNKTGIPLGKIQSGERQKLMNVEEVLKKRVIGQDHAIRAVSEAILESRSGLTRAGQPVASFFLLGSTGTGKTELAKSLADFLFNDESFLIRFDMSEFKEEHSAALLYGAPPGYVGYEDGGMLVNKIREKPYCVLLFDEIEKAHPSVFDIFLQILDEGKMHDRLGKEGDFSNAIILFTSNIGSEFIIDKFSRGQVPSATDLLEIMTGYFRPEFLGRLTEIVPFAPISEENAIGIFDIHLRSLTEPLTRQGVTLTITPDAKRHLTLSGFTPKYGARQLKGIIRNELRRPIARRIISGEVSRGSVINLDLSTSGVLEWNFGRE